MKKKIISEALNTEIKSIYFNFAYAKDLTDNEKDNRIMEVYTIILEENKEMTNEDKLKIRNIQSRFSSNSVFMIR